MEYEDRDWSMDQFIAGASCEFRTDLREAGENRKETEIFHGFNELSCDGPLAPSIANSRHRRAEEHGVPLEKKRNLEWGDE